LLLLKTRFFFVFAGAGNGTQAFINARQTHFATELYPSFRGDLNWLYFLFKNQEILHSIKCNQCSLLLSIP
jgi:hypothetical protein